MAVSSEYHVNIIISSKDRTSQGAGAAKKSLNLLTEAAKAAALGYAALRVAQKAIDFVEFGASVQRAATAVDNLAARVGQDGTEIIAAIQEASDFTIDKMTAMEVANKALLMGVAEDPEQFRELAHTATVLGRAMGLDATRAIDRFTIAAGRKSVKVADDLGLLIDASIANENYAKSLGKTVEQLTASEQSQAFLNAMMEAAEPKVAALTSKGMDFKGSLEQIGSATKDMGGAVAELVTGNSYLQASFGRLSNAVQFYRGLIVGTVAKIQEKRQATEEVSQSIIGYNGYVGEGVSTMHLYGKKISEVSYLSHGYRDILNQTMVSQDNLEKTILDTIQALEDEKRSLYGLTGEMAVFALDASMQWTDHFRDVKEQSEQFIIDREELEAEHQEKINDLREQGQSRAIKIDEEAEWSKLALLEERLAIELQRQAEFTDKTKESQRMAKDLAIRRLQEQITEQKTLLDDFYGGRLVQAGKNVDALIEEENRRHEEAVAGLVEEIEKTKELQRQQLGTLMLQTFEAWGEMKGIPVEAMFDMRLAIAEGYGLIGEEEAKYLETSIARWEKWAAEDFKQPADEVQAILAGEIEEVKKFGDTLANLESPPPIYIDVYYREHGRPESVSSPVAGTSVTNNNTTNNYLYAPPAGDPTAEGVMGALADAGLLAP